jgi:hypothetical protein
MEQGVQSRLPLVTASLVLPRLGVSAFFWAFPPPPSRDASFTMNKAREQIEFANIKLQRIEKKLGSDSNSLPIKK